MSSILNAQSILEHNEDIIAAVVENLQIGRFDDCIQHYVLLQANLVSLATELDNYPSGDSDPYQAILNFPDVIMRKDLLEDLAPKPNRTLPKPPMPPACQQCAKKQVTDKICRQDCGHIHPSSKFTTEERDEFLHVAQLLAARHRQYGIGLLAVKSKKTYRRWYANEIHDLLVAISLFGYKNVDKLSSVLEDRAPAVIKSFLKKNFSSRNILEVSQGHLPAAPNGYQPSAFLAPHYAATLQSLDASGLSKKDSKNSVVAGGDVIECEGGAPGLYSQGASTYSYLAPREGHWLSLMSMAAGGPPALGMTGQPAVSGESSTRLPPHLTPAQDLLSGMGSSQKQSLMSLMNQSSDSLRVSGGGVSSSGSNKDIGRRDEKLQPTSNGSTVLPSLASIHPLAAFAPVPSLTLLEGLHAPLQGQGRTSLSTTKTGRPPSYFSMMRDRQLEHAASIGAASDYCDVKPAKSPRARCTAATATTEFKQVLSDQLCNNRQDWASVTNNSSAQVPIYTSESSDDEQLKLSNQIADRELSMLKSGLISGTSRKPKRPRKIKDNTLSTTLDDASSDVKIDQKAKAKSAKKLTSSSSKNNMAIPNNPPVISTSERQLVEPSTDSMIERSLISMGVLQASVSGHSNLGAAARTVMTCVASPERHFAGDFDNNSMGLLDETTNLGFDNLIPDLNENSFM